jgi:hypothetical protein
MAESVAYVALTGQLSLTTEGQPSNVYLKNEEQVDSILACLLVVASGSDAGQAMKTLLRQDSNRCNPPQDMKTGHCVKKRAIA